jgi:hypothetical protein
LPFFATPAETGTAKIMSENYNIRDFRNAGLSSEDAAASDKSNRIFNICVIAIPVLAAVAGLGYKPVMDLRVKNVAAVQQAELDMESRRRAENPIYALKQDLKNSDGLIDPNVPLNLGGQRKLSPAAKARNDFAKRPLNAQEFLSRVDAKAHDFSPLEMETLKFERATWALTTCGHTELRAFYIRQNRPQYEKLDALSKEAKEADAAVRHAAMEKQLKKSEKHFKQLGSIETKGQALAFVASGGAGRHMDAIGGFGGMSNLMGDMGAHNVRKRRQRFNKRNCMQVRTIVQSGTMRVKPNARLR